MALTYTPIKKVARNHANNVISLAALAMEQQILIAHSVREDIKSKYYNKSLFKVCLSFLFWKRIDLGSGKF